MKKVFSLLSIVLAFSLSTHVAIQAQVAPPTSSGNGSTSSVMPTGNSGAMANQTNNVDLSTGGVSLSIPIYSLGSRNLSTTVSLSYQTPTSSFWYDEYPSSWVGRDWVLNAGGIITKEINPGSISDTTIFPIYPGEHTYWGNQDIKTGLFAKGDEHRPDVYYYNFDGYAGKFIVVNKDGEKVAITIPQSDLKIIPHDSEGEPWEEWNPKGWTIYTPNGTVYTFGGDYVETTDYEIDYSEYYMNPNRFDENLEHHPRPSEGSNYYPNRFTSVETNTGWYLNKINTPYANDSITFEYGDPYSSPLEQATIKYLVNYETDKEEIRKYKVLSGEVRNQRRISKIISLTGSIDFYETTDSLINRVEVKNKSEELIHKYHLNYQRKDDDNFLVLLQEKVADCIEKPPYVFEYLDVNGTQIGQDSDYNSVALIDGLPGGLQKIIYPEGGHTKFVYEANRADVTEWEYKDVEERIVVMKDTYDTLDVRYIEIGHTQDLHIRTSHYTNDYGIKIEDNAGLTVFNQIITDSLDFILPLSTGKYKVIIDHINNYSLFPDVIVHLKWKQKWLEPNTNINAKGWRVRKIVIHDGIDESKNIVKTYKYELENGNSSGRLIAPPLRFPENTGDYDWRSGSFDAYTYNYYIYESETNLDVLDYSDLSEGYYGVHNYHTLGVPRFYPPSGQDTMARLTTYKVYTSLPNYLKGATQIQYTKVTELYGESGEQGYVENYFSYEENEIETSAPLFTTKDNSWKRGFPIKTKVFDKDGNIISETTSEYEFSSLATHPNQHHEENTLLLIDRTASYNPIGNLYNPTNGLYYYNNYAQRFMVGHHYGKLVAGSVFLNKTTTTNYDQDNSGNSISSSTEYEYSDKYHFPKRIIQNENNGDKTISESKYVLDYPVAQSTFNQPEMIGLRTLQDKYIISPTIEQTVWKQKAGQTYRRLLGASLSTFQLKTTVIRYNSVFGGSINYYHSIVPLATYSFEPTNTWQPILEGDFTYSSITSNGLEWDNRYKPRVMYEGSDRFGNVTCVKEKLGTPSATIFGYNGLFPVASVSGANHRQVAYEGFESYGEENQYPDLKENEGFRGKYSSSPFLVDYEEGLILKRRYLIYPNSSQPIPAGTYTLSFWAKGNVSIHLQSSYDDVYNLSFTGSTDEWTYHEKDVILSYDATYHTQNPHHLLYRFGGDANARIDEIRFQPKNSFMSTTTYKPLVGVTHTTDTEQRTSSYYYDPLRRVESVRDHKNNLIKSYEYKYMSEDAQSNPLFSISTTPEALINTSITANVDRTELNRCLNSNLAYKHKWSFGDGMMIADSSIIMNQPHTYTQAGTYVITLSVEVVTGYWVDAHTSIRIIDPNSPPDLTNELTVTLNGTVDPTNSLCYDLVATPSGGTAPFTYEWLSGDGTSNPTQTGATLNYCYTSFGNFTPRVIITDATGATANATFDLTVTNPVAPLTAEIISNNEFCKGSCAFFDATVTGGTPAYTYLWEIINPYTNRNITLGTESSLSFKIPNPTPSNQYTVYLTVTDSEGREVTTTKTVTVLDDADCATGLGGFIITDNRGRPTDLTTIEVGSNVVFTSPFTGNSYLYEWEIIKNGTSIMSFNNQSPSLPFTFPSEGNYTIKCVTKRAIFDFGGAIQYWIVGTTTITISICDALDLPRF